MYEKVVENRVLEQHIACNNIICKHTVQSVVIQEEKQADWATEQVPSCQSIVPVQAISSVLQLH